MEIRALGETGLRVSRLGAELAEIGFGLTFTEETKAAQVLNAALDGGITFLDTAACYGIYREMAALGPMPGALENRFLLSLDFAFAHNGVDVFIVGTHNPQHMQANLGWVETELPIPSQAVEELHRRFEQLDVEWEQQT
jgi:aryl-alcohol dehydrogenase-like predicted oxidoreductase